MKCPHLSDTRIVSCTADRAVYIPSLFELEEYCNSTHYIKCPLSRGMLLYGKEDALLWSIPQQKK